MGAIPASRHVCIIQNIESYPPYPPHHYGIHACRYSQSCTLTRQQSFYSNYPFCKPNIIIWMHLKRCSLTHFLIKYLLWEWWKYNKIINKILCFVIRFHISQILIYKSIHHGYQEASVYQKLMTNFNVHAEARTGGCGSIVWCIPYPWKSTPN